MKAFTTSLCSFLLLLATLSQGQNYEPLDLAQKIFSKDSVINVTKYITGSYKGTPSGQNLPLNAITKFSLLLQGQKKAVVAMTALDSSGMGFDSYLHFEKDTVWKMSAFRGLAMTGMIARIKAELEKMTPQQVDSTIKSSKTNDHVIFASRDEYKYMLGNFKLTISLDDTIVKHFNDNKQEFEKLKTLAFKELEKENPDEERSIKLLKESKAAYRNLFVSSVSTGGYELGNCIKFLIGGMIDNTVGYLYVTDPKHIPNMNSDRVIMIRKIADGWYIYKTT